MFAAKLRPLYYISEKLIVRSLRSNRLTANPGLNKRLQAFESDRLRIEDDDVEEFIEASASDFANVGEAYNEHMNETLVGKYELRHRIVKDKYFKEHMPNLLTWSEKEQIRHLATTAADEWTPEKLAASFPVTEQTVKKLLKYPWKPATEERIARHDASVMRNWRELKEGSLSISDELRQHFLKFSERTIPPLQQTSIKIDLTKERKMGEYESIVKKCAEKEEVHSEANECNNTQEEKGTYKKKDYKLTTLDDLKEKLQKRLDHGNSVDLNDEIIVNTIGRKEREAVSINNSQEIELYENKSNELTKFEENNETERNIMAYPERIRIPKKAYKKNATYKVKDCYYDHDGKFLYRVLGMSN